MLRQVPLPGRASRLATLIRFLAFPHPILKARRVHGAAHVVDSLRKRSESGVVRIPEALALLAVIFGGQYE